MKTEQDQVFKATIVLPSRSIAQALATKWACKTRRGYSLGPTGQDGSASLTLDGITVEYREWLDAEISEINASLS